MLPPYCTTSLRALAASLLGTDGHNWELQQNAADARACFLQVCERAVKGQEQQPPTVPQQMEVQTSFGGMSLQHIDTTSGLVGCTACDNSTVSPQRMHLGVQYWRAVGNGNVYCDACVWRYSQMSSMHQDGSSLDIAMDAVD